MNNTGCSVKQQLNIETGGNDVLCGAAAIDEANVQRNVGRQTVAFSSNDHFVVPEGVTELRIFAVGASGGAGNGFGILLNNGGEGGTAVSNVKVSSGESLEIFVGVRGQDGDLPDGGQGGSSTSGFEGGTQGKQAVAAVAGAPAAPFACVERKYSLSQGAAAVAAALVTAA